MLGISGLLVIIPFFLGIAMGCAWAFVALWNFVHHGPPGVPIPNRTTAFQPPSPLQPPRTAPFSKAAAAGAILSVGSIPFGLIVFLIIKAIVIPSMESGSQLNGPVGGNIIIFGFLPALIGVGLGWKAVGDFRYHRGHLRGGGTAVFAALGIPVLAVIVTALANFEDIDRAINPIRIGWSGTLAACLVVISAFAASIWAVIALWRFVHNGPAGTPLPAAPQPPIAAPTDVPFEYRSPRQWAGMPLVHIVRGRDPRTGKVPVARGVIAIGLRAHGIVAIGVIASGGLALGTIAFGVFSMGALAVGIMAGGAAAAGVLALGSLAIGFYHAIGAIAIGDIAKGSLAIGRFYTEGATRIQLDSLWSIANGLLLVTIGAWSAMVPGFREIRKTTDASRPWSPAGFRTVIACIAFLALCAVNGLVPTVPTFRTPRPVPPPVAVKFTADPIQPDSHSMELSTSIPYGWMIDFTFFQRDANGTVEIPMLGYTIAARTPPPPENLKGAAVIPIVAKWALGPSGNPSVRFDIASDVKVSLPVKSGWWQNGSGSSPVRFAVDSDFFWQPHPDRPQQNVIENGAKIPFLRGVALSARNSRVIQPVQPKTGIEFFLAVEFRPLGIDEPVPEYTIIANIPRQQRANRLRADFALAEKHPEYIKRKAELDSAEARLKAAGDKSPEAASLKREVQKAQNRAWFLREELAVPQTGENLAGTTPALIAVKIKIADLLAKLRDYHDEVERQPANGNGPRTIIVPEEIEAAGKELDAAKAERMELIRKLNGQLERP